VSDVIGKAETFLKRGDVQGAANFLKQAEEGGDALAARELASWCLSGQYVRRDLCASRSFFERAAELGDHYSKEVTRAFVAGGVGGPADWLLELHGGNISAHSEPGAGATFRMEFPIL